MRLSLPATTPEILLGDDSEADHAVYALYAKILSGALNDAQLEAELDRLSAVERAKPDVLALVPAIRAQGAPAPLAIYVRRTGAVSTIAVSDHLTAATRHHDGAWPLALDMYQAVWLSEDGVRAVRTQMLRVGERPASLAAAADAAVVAGFLDPATVSRF